MFEPHRRCSGLSPDSALRGHSQWAPWGACLDPGRPPLSPGQTLPKTQIWIPRSSGGSDGRAKGAGSLWGLRPRPPSLEPPNSMGTSLVGSFLLCLKLLCEFAPPCHPPPPSFWGVATNPAPHSPSRPLDPPFSGSSSLSLEGIQARSISDSGRPTQPPQIPRLSPGQDPVDPGVQKCEKVPPDTPNAGGSPG